MNANLRNVFVKNADHLVERMLEELGEGLGMHLEGEEVQFADTDSGEIADALVEALVNNIKGNRDQIEGMVQYIQEEIL